MEQFVLECSRSMLKSVCEVEIDLVLYAALTNDSHGNEYLNHGALDHKKSKTNV